MQIIEGDRDYSKFPLRFLKLSQLAIQYLKYENILTVQDLLDIMNDGYTVVLKGAPKTIDDEINHKLISFIRKFGPNSSKRGSSFDLEADSSLPEYPSTTPIQKSVFATSSSVNSEIIPVHNEESNDSLLKNEKEVNYKWVPIESLGLSRRTFNSLKRIGIDNIGDVLSLIERGALGNIRNIGEKSENEIAQALKQFVHLPEHESSLEILPDDLELSESNNQLDRPLSSSLQILDDVSIAILDIYLPEDIINNLNSIGITTIGPLRAFYQKLTTFLSPNNHIFMESVFRSLWQKIFNRVDKGFIHKKVIINGGDIVTFLEKSPKTIEEQSNFLHVLNQIYKYSTIDDELKYVIQSLSTRDSRLFFTHIVQHKTLESIGNEEGVSRERIRQIIEKCSRQINYFLNSSLLVNIQTACLIAQDLGDDLSKDLWKSILIDKKLLTNDLLYENINSFDLLCALIISNRSSKFIPHISEGLRSLLGAKNKSSLRFLRLTSSQIKPQIREIRRVVSFTCGINIDQATNILRCSAIETKNILLSLGYIEVLPGWFSFSKKNLPLGRSPIRKAGLIMVEACGVLPFEEFCDGLRRHISRHFDSIANPIVIKHALKLFGFSIENDLVSWSSPISGVMMESERIILDLFKENGPILSFQEIVDFYLKNGYSAQTATIRIMSLSPIIEKVETGYYKLRGTRHSYEDLEIVKGRQEVYSKNPEVIYGLDGLVRYQITLTTWCLSGVVSISRSCQPLPDLTNGWNIYVENSSESYGKAKRDDTLIWGLSPAFNALSVKMGDRVELVFNAWEEPKVTVRLVNDK